MSESHTGCTKLSQSWRKKQGSRYQIYWISRLLIELQSSEKKPKESSWPTYMGRRPFPKLYLSQFSFKTGLRKTENWIKGYLIKCSIFVWFLITWASWKQNYQGKLFICLNIMWVPYRLQKNKPKVNWKKTGVHINFGGYTRF